MENCPMNQHTFFENASATGTSDYAVVSNQSLMTLKFESTGTFSVKVLVDINPKTKFHPYFGIKFPTLEVLIDTFSDETYLYQIDLHGIDYVQLEITSITGQLSAYGKVVG